VIRFRVWLGIGFAVAGIAGSLIQAQILAPEGPKQLAFLQAASGPDETPTPKPRATAKKKKTTKASPSPKAKPKPSETPEAKKTKSTNGSDEDVTPTPGKKKKAKTSPSAGKKKKGKKSPGVSPKKSGKASVSPVEEPALPSPSPSPSPSATPQSTPRQAFTTDTIPQVNVEKSGFLGDQGYEPPPTPAPKHGWWPWSRREVTYRYLSRAVRSEIDRAPVMRRRWQFIVVHNSGTRQGSARIFDYYHRHVRRMQNGLAYHFVIGNGTSTGNGEIEVGDRWRRQINGGHVHSDYLNNIALGICLVGDFNRDQPTQRQLEACEELIRYLRQRCGKIDAHYAVVRPHREVNPPQWATDCPGDDFPYQWFRRFQE
jgi:outer membrane biosynthesis protein TonB